MSIKILDCCLEVIGRTDRGAHLQLALDKALKAAKLFGPDAATCVDLAYSFYRKRIRVGWLLGRFLKNQAKLPVNMPLILSLAMTALLEQKGIPPYAVVSETVEYVKKRFGHSLGGVANGVLRSFLRNEREILDPAWYVSEIAPKSPLGGLAVYYGLPRSIAALWHKAYGFENTVRLMERSSRRPAKGLRINRNHPQAGELAAFFKNLNDGRVVFFEPWSIAILPGANISNVLSFPLSHWLESGAISLQAMGSQTVLRELGLHEWDGPVWDACAGIGGKSMTLANIGVKIGLASDLSPARSRSFKILWNGWAGPRPLFLRMDVSRPAISHWPGDILVDAPCSGLGVLGRRPDLRKIGSNLQARLRNLEQTQGRILDALLPFLQPGRKLAWVTCALNPAENKDLVHKAMISHPELSLEKEWTTPHGHPWLEGMYGAVLKRE